MKNDLYYVTHDNRNCFFVMGNDEDVFSPTDLFFSHGNFHVNSKLLPVFT